MFEIERLANQDSRMFLARVFEYGVQNDVISSDRLDVLHEQIVAISNKLITVRVRDSSSKYEIQNWVTNAFGLISLGLEYATSNGDLAKAAKLLNQNKLIKFFQIGNTLAKRLTEYARQVKENGVLVSPVTKQIEVTREEVKIYNTYEEQFLETVMQLQLNIDHADVVLDSHEKLRPIIAMEDLNLAKLMLNNLELRSKYYRILPKDKIFDADFTALETIDSSEMITQALMINLALYRQLEFHVNQEDIDNFHDIFYDDESNTIKKETVHLLIGWIGHFLDEADQAEEVKRYTVQYWHYCLDKLKGILKNTNVRS